MRNRDQAVRLSLGMREERASIDRQEIRQVVASGVDLVRGTGKELRELPVDRIHVTSESLLVAPDTPTTSTKALAEKERAAVEGRLQTRSLLDARSPVNPAVRSTQGTRRNGSDLTDARIGQPLDQGIEGKLVAEPSPRDRIGAPTRSAYGGLHPNQRARDARVRISTGQPRFVNALLVLASHVAQAALQPVSHGGGTSRTGDGRVGGRGRCEEEDCGEEEDERCHGCIESSRKSFSVVKDRVGDPRRGNGDAWCVAAPPGAGLILWQVYCHNNAMRMFLVAALLNALALALAGCGDAPIAPSGPHAGVQTFLRDDPFLVIQDSDLTSAVDTYLCLSCTVTTFRNLVPPDGFVTLPVLRLQASSAELRALPSDGQFRTFEDERGNLFQNDARFASPLDGSAEVLCGPPGEPDFCGVRLQLESDRTFSYEAGTPILELTDGSDVYVLYAAPGAVEIESLVLPPGWVGRTRLPDEDWDLDSGGFPVIFQDPQGNLWQRIGAPWR